MTLLIILSTALLSAVFTLVAVSIYFKRVLEPRLKASLATQSEALTAAIEARVKAGVEAGIASGIEKAASPETLVRATRSATRSSASLVEDGLNVLLGTPRKKDER